MNNSGRNALIVLVIFVAAFAAIRKPILQDRFLGVLRPFVVVFCPPADFYTPVLNAPLDVATTNKPADAIFTVRYTGRHVFGIFVKNYPKGSVAIPKFELQVQFLDGSRELASGAVRETKFTFWGVNGGDGFAFGTFDVPGMLPLGTPVRCIMTVTRTDPEFQAAHGPLAVFVAKDVEL